ncbi:hypothetical protein FJR45_02820 [Sulfurimonas sediminis]|uniref:Uncharacterized protein n=1 Tax=Sulfurimonas sediminis TaxID=2590020 RepID=A0A7M1AZK9_9BACT|nr:hypothetical protein [Sulfurimonas sediminis]QOP42939.1 hypothetical protein FJR45_02820 [Sulfurimonas sediminis]
MKIETRYNYEKSWTLTPEKDIVKIIEVEIGNDDVQGVLGYIKEAIKDGKEISVATCKFRRKKD